MNGRHSLIALGLLCVLPVAHATQVYQNKDSAGHVVFSDQPTNSATPSIQIEDSNTAKPIVKLAPTQMSQSALAVIKRDKLRRQLTIKIQQSYANLQKAEQSMQDAELVQKQNKNECQSRRYRAPHDKIDKTPAACQRDYLSGFETNIHLIESQLAQYQQRFNQLR